MAPSSPFKQAEPEPYNPDAHRSVADMASVSGGSLAATTWQCAIAAVRSQCCNSSPLLVVLPMPLLLPPLPPLLLPLLLLLPPTAT